MPETPLGSSAAPTVPDHVRDDRRAMIGDDHDVHAVGELELGGARDGLASSAFGGLA